MIYELPDINIQIVKLRDQDGGNVLVRYAALSCPKDSAVYDVCKSVLVRWCHCCHMQTLTHIQDTNVYNHYRHILTHQIMEFGTMTVRLNYPSRNTKQIDVQVGSITLNFSYETVIAFDSPFSGFVISENVWSTTTGRHLNEIHPDKDLRITHNEFEKKLQETLEHYGLSDKEIS